MEFARSHQTLAACIIAILVFALFPYLTILSHTALNSKTKRPAVTPLSQGMGDHAESESLIEERSYASSRASALDERADVDSLHLPTAAFSLVRGLARKIGLGAKKALKLGSKLAGGGAEDSELFRREVPWIQHRQKRASFSARSDRASRASSFGSNSSEASFTTTPLPSPLSSPTKGQGKTRQRRQPTMTRIVSGQGLDLMGLENQGRGNMESEQIGRRHHGPVFEPVSNSDSVAEQDFVYNGHLAVDCLPFDTTDAMLHEVKLVVPDQMLLMFGASLGESSAQLALGLCSKSTQPESLYGPPDNPDAYSRGWEKLVEEHKNGLHYFVHRRSLRKGLYMYKSRAVYEMASTSEMVAFTFADHEVRRGWDDSSTALQPLPPPSWSKPVGLLRSNTMNGSLPFGRGSDVDEDEARSLATASYCQSSFMYARTRFPPPMAQREYVYARRVWYKPDDGGCYCISKNCPDGSLTSPSVPNAGCRTVRVRDYSSGLVIRAVPGIYYRQGAVEVITNYFEDSCAASGLINMAVRKALWPMIQKSEGGFRRYQAATNASCISPSLTRRLPPFDSPPPPPPPSRLTSKIDDSLPLSGESEDEVIDIRCILSETGGGKYLKGYPSLEIDRNAGMFTEYSPALSYPRLHLTSILYALYLVVMRVGALALQLMTGLFQLLLTLPRKNATALQVSSKALSDEGAAREADGKKSAVKVSFSSEGQVSKPVVVSRSMSRAENRKQGLLKRIASLVVVASRAVTVPLLHQAMLASDESRSNQQRAFNTTQQNIKGARAKFPRTKAFVKAVLGQQLSDLREDFFYY